MSGGAYVATHAAAAAALAQATKAMGGIVKVEPEVFMQLLGKADSPWVVGAKGGFFGPKFKYLASLKGFFFYTESSSALALGNAELIWAEKIWIPG
jgi:hypothetical protein